MGQPIKEVLYNEMIKSNVSYNEKQLHVWNDKGQVNQVEVLADTGSQEISCVCYCPQYLLYFVASTDFKLHVFNEHLLLVGWLPLDVSQIHCMVFIPGKEKKRSHDGPSQLYWDKLVTGGINGCYMFPFRMLSKYKPQ
jgi:hypothetical protein